MSFVEGWSRKCDSSTLEHFFDSGAVKIWEAIGSITKSNWSLKTDGRSLEIVNVYPKSNRVFYKFVEEFPCVNWEKL
jgi:hypothetical protein